MTSDHRSQLLLTPAIAAVFSTLIAVFALRFMHGGSTVLQTSEPTRIVALSPGIAEILFALHMVPQVVGITDNTTYPPKLVEHKARIGGFFAPSIERILALDPNLVICRSSQRELASKLEECGLSVLRIPDKSLNDVLKSITIIGSTVGRTRLAKGISDRMKASLNRIRHVVSRRPTVPTLIVVGRADATLRSLYGVGGHTVLNRLITIAGGRNVLASSPISYPVINKEALLHSRPKVIIEISAPPSPWSAKEIESSWAGFLQSGALSFRLRVSQQPYWLVPGPRLVEAARQLAAWIHPEIADRLPTLTPAPRRPVRTAR